MRSGLLPWFPAQARAPSGVRALMNSQSMHIYPNELEHRNAAFLRIRRPGVAYHKEGNLEDAGPLHGRVARREGTVLDAANERCPESRGSSRTGEDLSTVLLAHALA